MGSKIASKILEAAVEQFASSGFNGTTTKAVAKAANVTEGSLFRLFTSKEGLFSAAVHLEMERGSVSRQQLEVALGVDDFSRAIRRACSAFEEHTTIAYVRIFHYSFMERPDAEGRIVIAHANELSEALAARIRKAIQAGEVRRNIDPSTAALFLSYGFVRLRLSGQLERQLRIRRALQFTRQSFIDIFLAGLRRC